MPDGAVIIAAITSCTNTSNPRNVIAAGAAGAQRQQARPDAQAVGKVLAGTGLEAVTLYLEEAGLLGELEALGFGVVAYACTTCNGMSGALDPQIQQEIIDRDLVRHCRVVGQPQLRRPHPPVCQAGLPRFAAAGGGLRDCRHHPFRHREGCAGVVDGKEIRLKDIWPSDEEIDAVVKASVKPEQFRKVYEPMFALQSRCRHQGQPAVRLAPDAPISVVRLTGKAHWRATRTLSGMRPLAVLPDNITTDHLSPSNAIMMQRGRWRISAKMGLPEEDFNSYATHRGDHLTAQRATFANPTLKNEMVRDTEGKVKPGSLARVEPEGKVMRMWEAIETYMGRKQPLIIVAGADYGQGSSRDWAAKGVRLAGVEAIAAEGFERIHRTNLIGMGVLPLEFKPGTTRLTLGLDGTETYDVVGTRKPRADLTLVIHRKNGERVDVPVTCRLDSDEEVSIYEAGGVLQRFAQDFLESSNQA
jgi:aconitase A